MRSRVTFATIEAAAIETDLAKVSMTRTDRRDPNSVYHKMTVKDLQAGPYHYVYLVNGKREIRDPWNTSFDLSKRAHGVSAFVVPEVMPSR